MADEKQKWEKVKLGKFSAKSFSKIGGESETGGKCIITSGNEMVAFCIGEP